MCTSLKESLTTVCTGTCTEKSFECPEAHSQDTEDDLLDFVLPGLIALESDTEDNSDPAVHPPPDANAESDKQSPPEEKVQNTESATLANDDTKDAIGKFSLHSAIINAPVEPKSIDAESSSPATNKSENAVVGATTVETKTGGVDKSIIGMIVAGMVLVVAGITIKKNWSSIKNRFSSTPRTVNERTGDTANGTTPEEVPLKDKSPV